MRPVGNLTTPLVDEIRCSVTFFKFLALALAVGSLPTASASTLVCHMHPDNGHHVNYMVSDSFRLVCRETGTTYHAYEAIFSGIGVGAEFKLAEAVSITCPHADNPIGDYFGFKIAGGFIVGGSCTIAMSREKGLCAVGGISIIDIGAGISYGKLTIRKID